MIVILALNFFFKTIQNFQYTSKLNFLLCRKPFNEPTLPIALDKILRSHNSGGNYAKYVLYK